MLNLYIIQVRGTILEVYAYTEDEALSYYGLERQEIDSIKVDDYK